MTTPHTVESLTKLLKQCRDCVASDIDAANINVRYSNDGGRAFREVERLQTLLETIDALPNAVPEQHQDGKDARAVISWYAIPTSGKRYADEILIQSSRQIEGPTLWAVRLNGNCLNKSGDWEWEPMPSSRDDEFLARCRFDSPEAAIDAAIASTKGAV